MSMVTTMIEAAALATERLRFVLKIPNMSYRLIFAGKCRTQSASGFNFRPSLFNLGVWSSIEGLRVNV